MGTILYILFSVLGLILAWAVVVGLYVMLATIAAPPEASQPIPIGEPAQQLEGTRYLEYRVGVRIEAPASAVWALLTDAPKFPSWNSTIISIGGQIAAGQKIQLKAKVAPDRTFPLTVSTFEPNQKMVWEDGNKAFKGVRTFVLKEAGGATEVTMARGPDRGLLADGQGQAAGLPALLRRLRRRPEEGRRSRRLIPRSVPGGGASV